ncbi:Major facilitator superfamily domain general substrate transporter [Penicillium expansum]|nr:Major facilitator superfamily domain general substrate transporter [Penicillium expansum]
MGTAGDSQRVTAASVHSIDAENQNNDTQTNYVNPVRSWKSYVWDTWDLPPDQRWMLFKVDAFVLTFASIGYFLKNIDQSNVNNAFLSGMEEDLEMFGNQLVTSTSIWTVGYVIGQIPSNLLLTRISPRWVIPTLEVGWGLATICTSSVKSYKALYALRFLVGFFESGFYPGIHYLLGSWYTPREIGKRAMIFWLAGSVGTLFSGFLQAAAYTNLNGTHGYAGWRWLFIIDGIITLPLALAGYVFFPNLPQSGKKTWWTTEEEHLLSIKRMENIGRVGKKPWTIAKAKAILLSWHTYLLPLLYILWNNGIPQPAMGYWLKSFNAHPPPLPGTTYTISQINNLPLPTTAVLIVMGLIWGWLSDGPCRGARWPFIYIGAVITLTITTTAQLLFTVLMMKLPFYTNLKGRMAVYWLSNIGMGAGPLILSWINEICSDDTEKRALLVAMANDLAYVVQAVAPNFVWKTTAFPRAPKGYTWSIVLQILLILGTATVQFLLWHDKKKAAKAKAALSAIDPLESSSVEGDTSVASREDNGKVGSTSRVKDVGIA